MEQDAAVYQHILIYRNVGTEIDRRLDRGVVMVTRKETFICSFAARHGRPNKWMTDYISSLMEKTENGAIY